MIDHASMIRLGLLVGVVLAAGDAPARADDAEDRAMVRRAMAYLDDRQEAWSLFAGSKRGEGADATSCVSCHTGLSYALARPALGRFVGERAPEPGGRMLAQVGKRVEHWGELDSPRYRLMYDFDERKKVESRGTEAVVDALVLARGDLARKRTEPEASSRLALRHLWESQEKSGDAAGSWDWLNFGLEPWEAEGSRAFGASLAAIAVGSSPGYLGGTLDEAEARGVAMLRDYLGRRFPGENLYTRLWILEASREFEGLLSTEQRRTLIGQLAAARRPDGGWALADLGEFPRVDGTSQVKESDGHATGLVVLALLRSGAPVDAPEVSGGLAWLRTHQRADGSWPGRSVNKERKPDTFVGKLMSDAATAYAAMAIAEAGSR